MKVRPWQPDKGAPSGPQRVFLHDLGDVFELLHEGGIGSGKTDAGAMAPVYYREYRNCPSFVAFIFRHSEKDLDKHILPLVDRPAYYKRYAGGSLNTTTKVWAFPRGGIAVFAHAKRILGLHGPEAQYVWWDELSHWTGGGWMGTAPPVEYLFVNFTRVRSAGTNAYGPGKAWIKWRWGPWLAPGYLTLPEHAPPAMHDQVASFRRLIEAGHVPEPEEGRPLVPSGHVLWFHPETDGTETWEPPPKDEDDRVRRGLLSRACLRSKTEENVALSEGDPDYALRTQAAGAVLYQQLRGGDWDAEEPGEGFFKRDWFRSIGPEAVPWHEIVGILRRWDFAWSRHEKGGKQAERSPWSVGAKVAWTRKHPQFGRRWFLLHVLREQGDPNRIMRLVHETAKSDGIHVPVLAPVDFSAGKVVLSDLRNLLEGYQVLEQREHGDKHVRIATLQDPAQAEKIILVADEWNHAFRDEAARYPRRPNDQLDALAGAYLHVIEQEGGIVTPEQAEAGFAALAPAASAIGGLSGEPGRPRSAKEIWDEMNAERDEGPQGDWFGGDDYGVPG
jgi:phage terminase large subunit-like protein